MKKIYSLFFCIVLCSSLFISCDDNDIKENEQISKFYRGTNLQLTLNDNPVNGKSVMFATPDLSVADIMLCNQVIPGEDSLLFRAVKLQKEGDGYRFQSSNSNDDRKISFTGKQSGANLILDIQHEITSPVVGKWQPDAQFLGSAIPVYFNIVPINPDDKIKMYGFWGHEELTVEEFGSTIGGIFGLAFSMMLDISFELKNDGNFYVAWASKLPTVIPIEPGQTEDGLIRYNINNNMLYSAIALDQILGSASISGLSTDTGLTPEEILILLNLAQTAYKGLPWQMQMLNDNQNLYMIVDRNMMLPYMNVIIKLLQPLLSELDLGEMGEQLGITKEFFANFPNEFNRIVRESTTFEMQIRLKAKTTQKMQESSISRQQAIEAIKQLQNKKIN